MARKRQKGKWRRHMSREELAALVSQQLSPAERERVLAHLSECDHCRRLVAGVVLSHSAVSDPGKNPGPDPA